MREAEGRTPADTPEAVRARAAEAFGQLPLQFESNRGQADPRFDFVTRAGGYAALLSSTEAVFALPESGAARAATLSMKLVGSKRVRASGEGRQPGRVNYLKGGGGGKRITNVPVYSGVSYRSVYEGIDLVYYGNGRSLEYDFRLAPGSDAGRILLEFGGHDRLEVEEGGDLLISRGGSSVRMHAPVLYQEVDGARRPVEGRYVKAGGGRVGFEVGEYDSARPLVIDPVLGYSSFLGGDRGDRGFDIQVDAAGNAYVTGDTRSTNLPVTVGAFQPSIGGISDVFNAPGGDAYVAKLNAAGTALVYFSYLGGEGGDGGGSIALDAKGNAYITGYTFSNNFPLSANAFQPTHGGSFDAYVARVDNPSSFAASPPPAEGGAKAYAASASAGLPNPIDDSQKFVRQHYIDFLNREPDASGLAFWTQEIEQCGADVQCREVKRINVSAAFFLAIEFQNTGYLVHRLYRASHARVPRLTEFSPDTRLIREGVVVNAHGWEERLESNKRAFVDSWVQRADFRALYDGKGNAEYVDALFANAGVQPSGDERRALVDGLAAGTETRATVLRKVAEHEAFARQESNRAFVLMQYFGYLQRSPDDPPEPGLNFDGYDFWLSKLEEFRGNYIQAEMVKAFISAGEYRKRFGQD